MDSKDFDTEKGDTVSELIPHQTQARGGGLSANHKSVPTVTINPADVANGSHDVGGWAGEHSHRFEAQNDNAYGRGAYERSYSRSRTAHRPIEVVDPEEASKPKNRITKLSWFFAAIITVLGVAAILLYIIVVPEMSHHVGPMESMKPILPVTGVIVPIDGGESLRYVEYIVKVAFEEEGTTDNEHPHLDVTAMQRQNDTAEWEPITEIGVQKNVQYSEEPLHAVGDMDFSCNNCTGPLYALRLTSNSNTPTTGIVKVTQMGTLGEWQVLIAGIILVIMYIAIATDVMHRTLVALIGMFVTTLFLIILGKAPSLAEAFEWLDEGVLTLLFGMMVVVSIFGETGLFEFIAMQAYKASKGRYTRLMILLTLVTASLSAFLDNVTTMLLVAPVTMKLAANVLKIDPRPLLVAECVMSNIGGTATMIGDPPNIIIGASMRSYVGFVDFIINLLPGVVFIYVACLGGMLIYFRNELKKPLCKPTSLKEMEGASIHKPRLLLYISIVFATMLVLFFTEPIHHVTVSWTALLGAVAMLCIAHPHDIVHTLELVEWDTLVFFSALFITIEGLAEMGLIRAIGDTLRGWIAACAPSARLAVAIIIILWVSGIASAFLDNIPYTATMVPVVLSIGQDPELNLPMNPLIWALALGACLGGNGTLIGASANVVTVGLANRAGFPITFMQWFKFGFPTLLLSLVVATAYTMIVYVAIGFEG